MIRLRQLSLDCAWCSTSRGFVCVNWVLCVYFCQVQKEWQVPRWRRRHLGVCVLSGVTWTGSILTGHSHISYSSDQRRTPQSSSTPLCLSAETSAVMSTCIPTPAAHLIIPWPWPFFDIFDFRVNLCRGPAIEYMYTEFGVVSSSRLSFRAWTHNTHSNLRMLLIPYPWLVYHWHG